MKDSNRQYAAALYEITKGLEGKNLQEAVFEFFQLLVKKHKLKQSDAIINDFIVYAKKQEGIADLEITTAVEYPEKDLEAVKKVFGDKAEMTLKVDEDIMGGMIIKTENAIFDASLKTRLKNLKTQLEK